MTGRILDREQLTGEEAIHHPWSGWAAQPTAKLAGASMQVPPRATMRFAS